MSPHRLLRQEYMNPSLGRVENTVNIKSWLHTDYSNKNIPISTKEEYKLKLILKVYSA